jgi:hypothetical protein
MRERRAEYKSNIEVVQRGACSRTWPYALRWSLRHSKTNASVSDMFGTIAVLFGVSAKSRCIAAVTKI